MILHILYIHSKIIKGIASFVLLFLFLLIVPDVFAHDPECSYFDGIGIQFLQVSADWPFTKTCCGDECNEYVWWSYGPGDGSNQSCVRYAEAGSAQYNYTQSASCPPPASSKGQI